MASSPRTARYYAAIKDAADVANEDGPRVLADVAIRDGKNWNDRRLPEMGRALHAALDVIDTLSREFDALRTGVGALVGTTRCYKRPTSKLDPDPGPCGKCAACMARIAYYGSAE